jgi:CBS domain-containing protein
MFMIVGADESGAEPAQHKLTHVDGDATVLAASKLMRDAGVTELLVTRNADGLLGAFGIVTARDIVTHVIAAELDPTVLTAGDIAWFGRAAAAAAGLPFGAEDPLKCPENGGAKLAVLDGDGRLVGTVMLAELVASLSRQSRSAAN